MLINKEPTCFSKYIACEIVECVALVDGGWSFDRLQWTSMNVFGIQDGIIVLIVLIFHDILDLLLFEVSCKEEGVWDGEVWESDTQGEVQVFRIRSVV